MSRASRSFSFGFLGLRVYIILSLIDPFDYLTGTRRSRSSQGPTPRRGGDWRMRVRLVVLGRTRDRGKGARDARMAETTREDRPQAFPPLQLRRSFSSPSSVRGAWPPPHRFLSLDLLSQLPGRPQGYGPGTPCALGSAQHPAEAWGPRSTLVDPGPVLASPCLPCVIPPSSCPFPEDSLLSLQALILRFHSVF